MTTPDQQLLDKMSDLYALMLDVAKELHEHGTHHHAVQLAGMAGKVQAWRGEIMATGGIEAKDK